MKPKNPNKVARGSPLALAKGPTTWRYRFVQALSVLCGGVTPPEGLVNDWIYRFEPDGEDLQDWVGQNLPPPLKWAQCIEILDACAALADSPEEGYGHLDGNGRILGT